MNSQLQEKGKTYLLKEMKVQKLKMQATEEVEDSRESKFYSNQLTWAFNKIAQKQKMWCLLI